MISKKANIKRAMPVRHENQYTAWKKTKEAEMAKEAELARLNGPLMIHQYSAASTPAYKEVITTTTPFYRDPVIIFNALVGLNALFASLSSVNVFNLVVANHAMALALANWFTFGSAIVTIILKSFFSKRLTTFNV